MILTEYINKPLSNKINKFLIECVDKILRNRLAAILHKKGTYAIREIERFFKQLIVQRKA